MSIIDDKKIYDVAFLGSSPLVLMEATFLNLLSKKVLIIEESSSIGGAWSSLNLFGMRNIENAIHYFMPNTDAPKLLEVAPSTMLPGLVKLTKPESPAKLPT